MSELLYLDPLPRGIRDLRDDELDRVMATGKAPAMPELVRREGGSFENGTSHINLKCRTCYGTGTFRFWTPDRTEMGTYACPCIDQWTLSVALHYAGVGLRYQRLWWADLHREVPVPESYLSDPMRQVRAGRGLALLGEHGTGKTLIASLILKGLIGLGVDGYFTTFNQLIETFTAGWEDKEDALYFHSRIKGAEVLVIDDLGKENKSGRAFDMVRSLVDEVIRDRVANGRATIITSNEGESEIRLRYGSSVSSLLSEGVVAYTFVGEDFRDESNARSLKEDAEGATRPITLGGKRYAVVETESESEPSVVMVDFG